MTSLCDDHSWAGDGECPKCETSFRGLVPETPTDAERYRKLRGWMSSNVKEGWEEVEKLGAVAAWMSWEDFDQYLDGLPECNVGLMQKPLNPMKEKPE